MPELGTLQQSALSLILQFSKLSVCRSHCVRYPVGNTDFLAMKEWQRTESGIY